MQSAPETIPAAGMDVPSTCLMVGYVTDTGTSSRTVLGSPTFKSNTPIISQLKRNYSKAPNPITVKIRGTFSMSHATDLQT